MRWEYRDLGGAAEPGARVGGETGKMRDPGLSVPRLALLEAPNQCLQHGGPLPSRDLRPQTVQVSLTL